MKCSLESCFLDDFECKERGCRDYSFFLTAKISSMKKCKTISDWEVYSGFRSAYIAGAGTASPCFGLGRTGGKWCFFHSVFITIHHGALECHSFKCKSDFESKENRFV